jgi:para-nitrobenzyl esterase
MNMNRSIYRWFRPGLLTGAAGAISMGVALAGPMNPNSGDPIGIDGGKVAGTVLPSGIHVYWGIPYAQPPVRELRWHAPEPVKRWNGVFNADRPAPFCVQAVRSANVANEYPPPTTLSEDCLNLNIWTPPNAKAGDKIPVVAYIHGGGFRNGNASTPDLSGEPIVKKGVVYVALSYRLNVFGYFAHSELTKESGAHASGNWGVLDQIAGLQWIKRNIAAFGGDPANVTILGESAGSESVHFLQSSPLARGLFAKLGGWSGAAYPPGGQSPANLQQGEADGLKLQAALKVNSLAELRALSWQTIFDTAQKINLRTRPIIDGYSLPELPVDIFAAGRQVDVPVYVSSTAKDLGSNAQFFTVKTLAEFRQLAKQTFLEHTDEFLRLFPASNDEEAVKQARQVLAFGGFGMTNRDWARSQALTGKQPAYLAQFSRVQPYAPGVKWTGFDPEAAGAAHASDIVYWLGTYDYHNQYLVTRNWTAWDRELSGKMLDTLVGFARTGNPSTATVKVPRYDPNNEQRIVFGDTIYAEKMNSAQIEFLHAHPAGRGQQTGAVTAAN